MAGPNEALVRVNGHVFSWANCTIKIEGRAFEGIQGLSYGDKMSRAKVMGNNGGGPPLGVTDGLYETEDGKIEAIRETIEDIRQYLALLAASPSFGQKRFTITATMSALGKATVTDRIMGCRIIGANANHEKSPDESKGEIPFLCERILWNGLSLYRPQVF